MPSPLLPLSKMSAFATNGPATNAASNSSLTPLEISSCVNWAAVFMAAFATRTPFGKSCRASSPISRPCCIRKRAASLCGADSARRPNHAMVKHCCALRKSDLLMVSFKSRCCLRIPNVPRCSGFRLHLLPPLHPERSRARGFCAAVRTLDGEDERPEWGAGVLSDQRERPEGDNILTPCQTASRVRSRRGNSLLVVGCRVKPRFLAWLS